MGFAALAGSKKAQTGSLMPSHDEVAVMLRDALVKTIEAASPAMLDPFPTIDCSLVLLPASGGIRTAAWAQVLIQAGHGESLRGELDPLRATGPHNIRYLADPVNIRKDSIAWLPGANWRQFRELEVLTGSGPHRVIAPYPASVVKLMIAVGVCLLADRKLIDWQDMLEVGSEKHSVEHCCDRMITLSSNEATDTLVALLHQKALIDNSIKHNDLNQHFKSFDLHGLRLDNTTANGGWRNPDGAGVGQLQMTSWDCVRMLWLILDATGQAGIRPPWLASTNAPDPGQSIFPDRKFLSAQSANRFWRWMDDQARHEVLSSGLLAGVPGWVEGIPARLPDRWMNAHQQVQIEGEIFSGFDPSRQQLASVTFAHKTGSTWSYACDAGLVKSIKPGGRRYLIAMMSTLGMRHVKHPQMVTPWIIPASPT
ncbi:MAG: hypothetical protein EBW74_11940, partial [Betaproteobacteria bacterium]|nr:hypothetical protein [Betaproteobacteria bacterium]